MHNCVQRLKLIKSKINEIVERKQQKTTPEIIAVTKTHPFRAIIPLLDYGHSHYGENKVQEAENKWSNARVKYKNLKLHMLGKIQTNKAKKVVKLFDYIHSLDNAKLAAKISQFEKECNKKIKIFIQVNIANENQKSGILLNDLDGLYNYCTKELSLNIIGLMCMPPLDSDSNKYFQILKKTGENLNLKNFSMGMSADYEHAILNGSTYLRLGTVIFGERIF